MTTDIETLSDQLENGMTLGGLRTFASSIEAAIRSLQTTTGTNSTVQDRVSAMVGELLLSQPEKTRPCPLLELFRNKANDQNVLMKENNLSPGLITRMVGKFELVFNQASIEAAPNSLLGQLKIKVGVDLRGLVLRAATLQVLWRAMGDSGVSNLGNLIQKLITAYQTYFSTACWAKIPAKNTYRCSGFHRLAALASNGNNVAKKLSNAIEEANKLKGVDHRDPAVAFVFDTLAIALGSNESVREPLGQRWRPGDSWVLLGAKNSKAAHGTGMVLRLRTMKSEIPKVNGLAQAYCPATCYPDPIIAAHSPVDEDFQIGIRNAWVATQFQAGSESQQIVDLGGTHDYRWHVAAIDRTEDHSQRRIIGQDGLRGESATLAYAVSIRSCRENSVTRADIACTAAFGLELDGKTNARQNFSNPSLVSVRLVADKAAAAATAMPETEREKAWESGHTAFDLGLKRIVVSQDQPTEFPSKLKLIPAIDWDHAWRECNALEAVIERFAQQSAKRWEALAASDMADGTAPREDKILNDVHRFALYVDPEFQWEDPNPAYHSGRGSGENPWIATNLKEEPETQLFEAIKDCIKHKRGLVLLDGAGAGKTVTSYKLQQVLTDPKNSQEIFGDGLPRLVFHWPGKLPISTDEDQPILELLSSDRSLLTSAQGGENQQQIASEVVKYALEKRRVVIIVDAFDELKGNHPTSIKAAVRDPQADQILWIFTGRDYAINPEWGDHGLFHPTFFRRIRIRPFSPELQNKYMQGALPNVNWRHSLKGYPTDLDRRNSDNPAIQRWDDLLGLPHTLREIVRVFELSADGTAPQFETPSDLFLQCARKMLERELKAKNHEVLTDDGVTSYSKSIEVMERALGAIALELAYRNQWKELIPNQFETMETVVTEVLQASKKRFEESCKQEQYNQSDIETHWQWAKKILNQFEFMNGAHQADVGARVISFSTRRVHEMRLAFYLAKFGTENDRPCVLQNNGNDAWKDVWQNTIEMPVMEINPTRYLDAMKVLFTRPPVDTEVGEQVYRRPTELMWQADVWIKARSKDAGSPLGGFDAQLRNYLQAQFQSILNGDNEQAKRIAEDLINIDNFVVLADSEKPIDEYDTGHFMWQAYVEEEETYTHSKVPLTKYGLCKYAVNNAQFQLFDDNFIGARYSALFLEYSEKQVIDKFGGANQPAVFISWSDAFWFCEFVRLRENNWCVCLPSEDQHEYGARAGTDKEYFRGEQGIEVTKANLEDYAHYGQCFTTGTTLTVRDNGKKPNAWGLENMAGNVQEFCWDWYAEYALDEQNIPWGSSEGTDRVLRCGCWHDDARACCSAHPSKYHPTGRDYCDVGFRLALSPSCPTSPRSPWTRHKSNQVSPGF